MLALARANDLIPATTTPANRESRTKPGPNFPSVDAHKKRAHSPELGSRADSRTGTTSLETDRRPISSSSGLRIVWDLPWKRYEKVYDLELAGSGEVALRKTDPIELVHVRRFYKPGVENTLRMFRLLRHPNIVAGLEAFNTDDGLYVILEQMPVALDQIVRSPAYPDERQLAAILGQV
jgi:hypothetical protein